jgi:site-specific DNA-methyltransferase (cytosine-N4-specific)
MTPYFRDDQTTLWHGDSLEVLRSLPDASVGCCVTSPPYFGLRDYGEAGQYGLEASPAEYVETMRAVFAEVRRVLADDGTLWLNIGDSYNSNPATAGSHVSTGLGGGISREHQGRISVEGLARKNLLGIPWRVAFALQDDGWTLRNDIIWHKPNAMPESVTDRLSTRHEHLFMLAKSRTYWFDLDPIREPLVRGQAERPASYAGGLARTRVSDQPLHRGFAKNGHDEGRNPGDVWSVPTQPFSAAHFAVMPQALAERAILAGCKPGGTVLDPFSGSGTTGLAAAKHGRKYVGIDLNADYLALSLRTRLAQPGLDFGEATA